MTVRQMCEFANEGEQREPTTDAARFWHAPRSARTAAAFYLYPTTEPRAFGSSIP